ncbi:hypothetical protein U9M48_027251 [Paspalum notatum var. saurae]|uniref:Uncharacterized protein n=1 Tax=Paspalum notatum var. saurae TaxID=547442 RepID=A0AAQ3TUP2_PASNO
MAFLFMRSGDHHSIAASSCQLHGLPLVVCSQIRDGAGARRAQAPNLLHQLLHLLLVHLRPRLRGLRSFRGVDELLHLGVDLHLLLPEQLVPYHVRGGGGAGVLGRRRGLDGSHRRANLGARRQRQLFEGEDVRRGVEQPALPAGPGPQGRAAAARQQAVQEGRVLDGARQEGRALLLPPLRAPHAPLHVQQLRAGLLLPAPEPCQLPRQRLPVPPQPLELALAAAAGPRRRSRVCAPAAAADVGKQVALPREEVGVRELPPVRAHLAESLHRIAMAAHTNSNHASAVLSCRRKVEKLACLKRRGRSPAAKACGSHTTKLFRAAPHDTKPSVAGSSTSSNVFARNGGRTADAAGVCQGSGTGAAAPAAPPPTAQCPTPASSSSAASNTTTTSSSSSSCLTVTAAGRSIRRRAAGAA